jgi:hypothetical protein
VSGAFYTNVFERIPAAAVAGAESPGSQLCMHFQQWLEEEGFAGKLVFSDKAMFHVCGKVSQHTVPIQGMEHPHAVV